jgi:integrase
MTVRKSNGRWFYRRWVRVGTGKKRRLYGTPRRFNLPNTRAGAQEAERRAVEEVLSGLPAPGRLVDVDAIPTVSAFAPTYIQHSKAKNKPRSVNSKEQILRDHILPALGSKRLDAVDFAAIEDFKHGLLAKPYRDKPRSAKMVNNALTVLRRMLVLAAKRGHIKSVPEIEWLPVEDADFDFLEFEEADRLVLGADAGDWRAMIDVALRTGLRQGELLALEWDTIDLERRRIVVVRQVSRGIITSPKGGKSRTVELGEVVTATLRAHRHLRGPLVFCDAAGAMLPAGACKWPLYRAARRAKLRRVGWHVLRHTYASHLAMLGASAKAIQEQLGHATLEMTMRYMHLSPATKQAAARLLDRPAQNLPDRDKSGGT